MKRNVYDFEREVYLRSLDKYEKRLAKLAEALEEIQTQVDILADLIADHLSPGTDEPPQYPHSL